MLWLYHFPLHVSVTEMYKQITTCNISELIRYYDSAEGAQMTVEIHKRTCRIKYSRKPNSMVNAEN